MLCDSNIIIYAAEPGDTCCAQFVEQDDAVIASISRIEVLGFPKFASLPDEHKTRLNEIIASMVELHLEDRVIQRAILLRQQRKMSLGDAIVAATALEHGMTLVTRNADDFKHIAGLTLLNPFDKP